MTKEILAEVAQIHNRLAEISVRGDDAIRLGEVLTRCRNLAQQLSNLAEEDNSADLERR